MTEEREAILQWAEQELDELLHTGYTCDSQGTMASARDDGRENALRDLLEEFGDGYEHDPETCTPCVKADAIMEEHTDAD